MCPLPFGSGGRGTLAGERRVGRVPIPTRGHTLWYSLYICTLCSPPSHQCCGSVTFWYGSGCGTGSSIPHKSEKRRNQGFSYYFCLMIEGPGAGSVHVNNGSGRPENIRIRIRMRTRNTASHPPPLYEIATVVCRAKGQNFEKGVPVMCHLQTIPVFLFNS